MDSIPIWFILSKSFEPFGFLPYLFGWCQLSSTSKTSNQIGPTKGINRTNQYVPDLLISCNRLTTTAKCGTIINKIYKPTKMNEDSIFIIPFMNSEINDKPIIIKMLKNKNIQYSFLLGPARKVCIILKTMKVPFHSIYFFS